MTAASAQVAAQAQGGLWCLIVWANHYALAHLAAAKVVYQMSVCFRPLGFASLARRSKILGACYRETVARQVRSK